MIATVRSLLSGAILSGTPLLYATLAELIGQRAGVVNLGLEGVMLMGAVAAFATMVQTGSAAAGVAAGALAGALFNMIFAFLVITRRANQLASGLALMFCGVGLSALLGGPYVGRRIAGLPELSIPWLAELPLLGPIAFQHDALVYAAVSAAVLTWWVLFSTRWGLTLRAVGENPTAAFAAGRNPHLVQYQALFVAGALAGIAGAHLSLGLARTWVEWMTGGPRIHRGGAGDFRQVASPARPGGGAPVRRRHLAPAPAAGARRARLALLARHAAVRAEPGGAGAVGRPASPRRAGEPGPGLPAEWMSAPFHDTRAKESSR